MQPSEYAILSVFAVIQRLSMLRFFSGVLFMRLVFGTKTLLLHLVLGPKKMVNI